MHRSRLTCVLLLAVALTVSVSMTSCGGGAGGSDPDLVLVGFNLPNIAGIPLNEALIFTFSAPINPASITPDTLRVVGTEGPFFETTVVDGSLVALLPRSPNFDTYEDAGLLPGINYSVSLTTFPAVRTIESTTGKSLLEAESFTFVTQPFPVFVEPRRPIRHGIPWTLGGQSDDAGCLQNSDNSLYITPANEPASIQTGSTAGATLLCLQNEGPPRVILEDSIPLHNSFNIGTPSAVNTGEIDMPAIRVRFNENLDPLTVTPFTPTTGLPINVQLWRVGQKDGTPIDPPEPIPTNEPVVVQNLDQTEIILVPAKSTAQGIYLVNVTPSVKDLPGNSLMIVDRPDPTLDGFDFFEGQPNFSLIIPPGYRIYFRTLELPSTPLSIVEDFVSNLKEWGDNDSDTDAPNEPGVYSASVLDAAGIPADFVRDGETMADQGYGAAPNVTLLFTGADPLGANGGQSTTAAWNSDLTTGREDPITDVDGYRFLNIPTLLPNPSPGNPKPGTLQAVHQPWCGSGADGAFASGGGGTTIGWNTNSVSNDGILEYESFHLEAGDTITVGGDRPLLILCQGEFRIDGTIILDGDEGKPGFDTDGSTDYDIANGSAPSGGVGGVGGPGGGAGGAGASPNQGTSSGLIGTPGSTLFDDVAATSGGTGPAGFLEVVPATNDTSSGGGGGGFGSTGLDGTQVAGNPIGFGGFAFGDGRFERDIDLFLPDRAYHPSANISGGSGGGGGSADDDLNGGGSEDGDGDVTPVGNGDDGGGGGGGAGGGIWVIAKGDVIVGNGAVISANGGRGGNTYARADQDISPGPDNNLGGGDDFLVGAIDDTAAGSGDGGPGGGGAGGGIFFTARGSITVDGGATITALGGAGGTSNGGPPTSGLREGGTGSIGRISLMLFETSAGSITAPAPAFDPVPSTYVSPSGWQPTIDEASVAQSEWVDLFTPNTLFNQDDTNGESPSFNGNFDFAGGGTLQIPVAMGGGGKVMGTDFDVKLEFQGADDVGPAEPPAPPSSHPLDGANGLTNWIDVSLVSPPAGPGAIDNKRFFRWRWRFWVKDGWGGDLGDPPNLPLPTVFDFTIPFTKP